MGQRARCEGGRAWRAGQLQPACGSAAIGGHYRLHLRCLSTLPPLCCPALCCSACPAFPARPAAYLSSEAQNLVKGLLQKEASKRLGYGPNGSADIMKHPFFKTVDWRRLEQRQVSGAKPSRAEPRALVMHGASGWGGWPPVPACLPACLPCPLSIHPGAIGSNPGCCPLCLGHPAGAGALPLPPHHQVHRELRELRQDVHRPGTHGE